MTVLVFLTALLVFAAAVVGLLAKIRQGVNEIHVMVNSRMDQALARIEQLHDVLRAAGISRPDPPEVDR